MSLPTANAQSRAGRFNLSLEAFSALLIAALASCGLADSTKSQQTSGRAPLAVAPLQIYDRLPQLGAGSVPRMSEEERRLLAQAWKLQQGKATAKEVSADDEFLLEALWLASGIESAQARNERRGQFDRLMKEAARAVDGTKDQRERGERLMKFLHAGVMSKGYDLGQSSFAGVFDKGTFNCVSSTALYYAAGRRLGLELRPISIPGEPYAPGHASLDMIDGNKRIQVEPTNPDGFDWQAKINRPGVTVLGVIPNRKKGREVGPLTVAAMIYVNRGVDAGKDKGAGPLEAIRCYLSALALDGTDEGAAKNLLATFANWGPDLAKARKFEQAVRVMTLAAEVAPQQPTLRDNQRFVWSQYVQAMLASGDDKQAVALMGRARAAGADGFAKESEWFIRHGDKLRKQSWDAALKVAERGLKHLSGTEARALREWRSRLFRGWSQALLDQGDVAGSLKVLERGYALDAEDREIRAGIAYHTQEALRILDSKGDAAAAAEHLQTLQRHFGAVSAVADFGRTHVQRVLDGMTERKQFSEALAALKQYAPLLAKKEQRAELAGVIYSQWALELAGQKKHKEALDQCAEGLKAFPKQDRILNGIAVITDRWADDDIKAARWDDAIRIYDLGLQYAPDSSHLRGNRAYCVQERDRKK